MNVAAITFCRYRLGSASWQAKPIPQIRWLAFKQVVARLDEVLIG